MRSANKKLEALLMMLLLPITIWAQMSSPKAEFWALDIIGSCIVDGQPLKIGDSILIEQQIELTNESYVRLVHSSGKMLKLTGNGLHLAANLSEKIANTPMTVADQYALKILNEIQNGRPRMYITGAVNAGMPPPMYLLLPDESYVKRDSKILIKWLYRDRFDLEVANKSGYRVLVKNIFDELVFETVVMQPQIGFDLISISLDSIYKEIMLVEVRENEVDNWENSKSAALRYVADSIEVKIEREIAAFPGKETVLGSLLLARYFEEKEMFGNAVYYWNELLTKSDFEPFRKLYNNFIFSNNFENR